MKLLLLVTLIVTAVLSQDQEMWNLYRESLKDNLSSYYCQFHEPGHNLVHKSCGRLARSVLQIIENPVDASLLYDQGELSENLAKYVPKFQAVYDVHCASYDCSFPKLYQDALTRVNDPTAYINFRRYKTTSFPQNDKSYPWMNTRQQDFTYAGPDGYMVVASVSKTSTTSGISWGHAGGYNGHESFMRHTVADGALQDEVMSEAQSIARSGFLFRRRRHHAVAAPPPPPPPSPVVISIQHHEIMFRARHLTYHQVQPAQWFDYNFLNQYQAQLGGEFFDPHHGKMSLLPNTAIVAHGPRVTVKVTNTVYHDLKTQLGLQTAQEIRVGGMKFTGTAVNTLGDDIFELMGDHGKSDTIYFKKLKNPIVVSQKSKPTKPVEEDIDELLTIQSDSDSVSSSFLFGRRRRAPPPPVPQPPPPPPPPPQVFTHEMVIESHSAQIIAVVSDMLPTGPPPAIAPAQPAPAVGDSIRSDGNPALIQGQCLTSPNNHRACMQSDGNFVVYGPGGNAIWASGAPANAMAPFKVFMQSDGNVVLYDGKNVAIWHSALNPTFAEKQRSVGGPFALVMQDDGNLVAYASNGTPVFWTK
jgi:hypothetical protein